MENQNSKITYRKFTSQDGDKRQDVSLDQAIKMINKAIKASTAVVLTDKKGTSIMYAGEISKKKKDSLFKKMKDKITKGEAKEVGEIPPVTGG